MIEDRSYGKAELAMLYFPTATPSQKVSKDVLLTREHLRTLFSR